MHLIPHYSCQINYREPGLGGFLATERANAAPQCVGYPTRVRKLVPPTELQPHLVLTVEDERGGVRLAGLAFEALEPPGVAFRQ